MLLDQAAVFAIRDEWEAKGRSAFAEVLRREAEAVQAEGLGAIDPNVWAERLLWLWQGAADEAHAYVLEAVADSKGLRDVLADAWEKLRSVVATRAAQITTTTRDTLASLPEDEWPDTFDRWQDTRPALIAADNAVAAVAFGQAVTMAAELPDVVKVWVTVGDDRVRPTHQRAHGQRRPIGAPYSVGGFPLMYPKDPTGPLKETIRCRCWENYVPALGS